MYNKAMKDCLFCSIANGDESKLVWHNDTMAAFRDIHPDAPVHLLVVPKKHYENLDDLDDALVAGDLMMAARAVAHQEGIKGNWRVRINNGAGAGQVINHLHVHVMGTKDGQTF
jgi:histidine triad (HIT) family protein